MTEDKIKEVKNVYSARSKSRNINTVQRPFFVGIISKLDKRKLKIRH